MESYRQGYGSGYGRGRRRGGFPVVSPVNSIIIAINIIVFIVMMIDGRGATNQSILFRMGANYCKNVTDRHEYYRTITAAFMHSGVMHIVNNMIVLGYLGDNLERALGKLRYILFYLLACIGSGMISAYWHVFTGDYVVSVGASGAIFAVAAALFVIVIRNRNRLEDLTAKRLGLFLALTAYSGFANAGVDNAGHIGGLICGLVLALVFYRKRLGESFYRRNRS